MPWIVTQHASRIPRSPFVTDRARTKDLIRAIRIVGLKDDKTCWTSTLWLSVVVHFKLSLIRMVFSSKRSSMYTLSFVLFVLLHRSGTKILSSFSSNQSSFYYADHLPRNSRTCSSVMYLYPFTSIINLNDI